MLSSTTGWTLTEMPAGPMGRLSGAIAHYIKMSTTRLNTQTALCAHPAHSVSQTLLHIEEGPEKACTLALRDSLAATHPSNYALPTERMGEAAEWRAVD